MYERAMKQLQTVTEKRDITVEEATNKNALKLIHFHIEAFDDKIALNKMDYDDDNACDINLKMVEPPEIINTGRPMINQQSSRSKLGIKQKHLSRTAADNRNSQTLA